MQRQSRRRNTEICGVDDAGKTIGAGVWSLQDAVGLPMLWEEWGALMAWQMTEDEKFCRRALMVWKMVEDERFLS